MLDDHLKSILVVENEPLIAMDVEAMLRAVGADKIHHALTCRQALDWIDAGNELDIAVLDLHLRDGPCTVVAERLAKHTIPFVIYSGDTHSTDQGDLISKAIWIPKPCTQIELTNALQRASGHALR